MTSLLDETFWELRADFLETFTTSLVGIGTFDRFALAGIIATWWNEALPDLKTLVANGFDGLVDGWISAIADAVEDTDGTRPVFDPLTHKLVTRTMGDFLAEIATSRTTLIRLLSERDAFESGNAPEDAEEDDEASWNYAKDLERRITEWKTLHRDEQRVLRQLTTVAGRVRATDADRVAADAAGKALEPALEELAGLEAALAPYVSLKADITGTRATLKTLSAAFVERLTAIVGEMDAEARKQTVTDLFARDIWRLVEAGFDERCAGLAAFLENAWDKYRVSLTSLRHDAATAERELGEILTALGYGRG